RIIKNAPPAPSGYAVTKARFHFKRSMGEGISMFPPDLSDREVSEPRQPGAPVSRQKRLSHGVFALGYHSLIALAIQRCQSDNEKHLQDQLRPLEREGEQKGQKRRIFSLFTILAIFAFFASAFHFTVNLDFDNVF